MPYALLKCCHSCNTVKDEDQFGKRAASADGKDHRCRSCNREVLKARYRANPKKDMERLRLRKACCTKVEFEALKSKQKGRCAICGEKETRKSNQGKIRDLSIDHCHVRGKVRGLLCLACNVVLGQMKDDPELLRRAADYLEGKL